MSAAPDRYAVEVGRGEDGWGVKILDPSGAEVGRRACGSESEALAYASTVRQHIYWLSEEKFREYYRLPAPDTGE